MKVNQIHQYLFCHKSRPVVGEMHLDHHNSIFVWPAPKVIQDGSYSWMILVYSVDYATITLQLCKQIMLYVLLP